MPDRMIREGYVHSPRVNALTDRAECAFVRLLLKVDDFGVYYAEPKLVRAAIWPTKSYRDADVVRVLDELERVRLIARFPASDGVRYLCLLRFRQRLAYGLRRRYPAPPFDEDTGEMRLFEPDPPEPVPPKKRREEKRREEKRGEGAPLAHQPPPAPVTDGEDFDLWIARLQAAWPAIAVQAEVEKAQKKKARAGEQLERVWFETNWLPKCSPVVTKKQLYAPKDARDDDEEPEGWRHVISNTQYGPGGSFAVSAWAELKPDVRKWVFEQLDARRAG